MAYTKSRFDFGRALRQYKQHYKAERGWMEAASVIANAIGRDPRTIFRIIEDHERATQLDPVVLEVMEERGIDAAAPKNAAMVANLLEMPAPKTREEAASAVKAASQSHLEKKRAAKKAIAKLSQRDGLDQFAHRILKQFGERYRSVKAERRDEEVRYILELVVNTLRSDIRELRQYGRPALVPKPTMKEAA
jgi:hypothetical protein